MSRTSANGGMAKGAMLVLLSATSFGVMPVLAKLAYGEGVNVNTLLALRFCIAAVAMWALWFIQYNRGMRASLRPGTHWVVLLPLVVMGVAYVGQSFSYFTAITLISASATGLLLYTYPILVTILAWLFFREEITPAKIGALAVATLGALMVLGAFSSMLGFGIGSLGTLSAEGVLWALAAALVYSFYIIAGTRFTADIDPIYASALIISSAALIYTIWGAIGGQLFVSISSTAWLLVAGIALVSTVVAIVTFVAGLRVVGPSRAAIISTLEPATTVLLAALILGETVTWEQIIGGGLVLASVVILQLAKQERKALAGQPVS